MKDGRHDGSPVKRLCWRLIGFMLLSALFAFGQHESAFAQAGSTGGTIGKTDKSISGGESAAEPRTLAKPRSSRESIEKGASGQAPGAAGRWRWIAECPSGHWLGEFDLAGTSPGEISGSFAGTSWYDVGTIADGHVNGASVSFTRKSAVVTQYWKGRLAAGRIKGTLSGNENCSWEATKK